MPRYVILTHDHPEFHWDFMLEVSGALRTWRLSQPPDSADEITSARLDDHRLAYLDYEGPVSGDRGEVHRWDAGDYTLVEDLPQRLAVRLNGTKLTGVATIVHPAGDAGGTFYFTTD